MNNMNGKDPNADICIIHYSVFTIHCSLKEEVRSMIDNPLSEKSLDFAAKTIKFCIDVNERTKENNVEE